MMMALPTKTDISKFIEVINIDDEDTYICLNNESVEVFKDITTEWQHKELFARHKLNVRNKILLHGASGNGKTTVAKFLARRAKLPMLQVRHEQIINSHLGESGKNVAQLFDSVTSPCILFFDEIDTITMSRSNFDDETTAGEEYNKALNVLLIRMERMSPEVILIGATNRMDKMDDAVIRRFDLLHEMPPPAMADKVSFAERQIRHYDISIGNEIDAILELNSFSDIKRALINHLRKALVNSIHNKKLEPV